VSELLTEHVKPGTEKLLKVLPRAAERLNYLLQKKGMPSGALRLAVIGGGCSGLQYKMEITNSPKPKDILVSSCGVNILIDPRSALFVSGSQIDYSDDLQRGGFKVINPNVTASCSCGESFSV
jgi:iron-sulfur cluster assembly accessory protein